MREMEANIFVFKQALILLENGVARLGQDLDEGCFVELVEYAHDGETADKLRNQPVLDQVLRLGLAQQLGIAMRADGCLDFGFCFLEAKCLLADATANDAFQAHKGSTADEEDVG